MRLKYEPTPRQKTRFSDFQLASLLAAGMNEAEAARSLGVSRQAVNQRKKLFNTQDLRAQGFRVLADSEATENAGKDASGGI